MSQASRRPSAGIVRVDQAIQTNNELSENQRSSTYDLADSMDRMTFGLD